MNKKNFWLVIPTVLLPYLTLFALATIFLASEYPSFKAIMESVFHGNAILLIITLLLYCLITAALSVFYFITGIRKSKDAVSLAKIAMIVKIIHIPAYILIFFLGIMLMITIFTIPFTFGLFLLDCFSLFLTGLMTVAAVINAVRQGLLKPKNSLWIIILQAIFCADVVATIFFYLKLKKDCTNE